MRIIPSLAIFLVVFVCIARAKEEDCSSESGVCQNPDAETVDPNCPSREFIISCSKEYLDTNKNGKLDRVELETAIDQLPWYSRGILKILGSVDKIMAKCDVDKDDAISMDYDMENNHETCLATCFKRKVFRNAFFPECE
mmetsp:Transcript_15070/g.41721  ORF Transcript_15070/g.41721 Transcript_15070/m.41721 type:complete len:140 (-) Transcript_15070:101-520(-)|eukprot:CAMPEP_0198115350 /NCGR_PEP_ID=MMETSP1442-20131203/6490_1 /TAXON_ID= /ORGANISM="Craspedostauros australis, Strain CCMP3328" /LENGTH=139 /DNA_ID=CAMNT_0043772851 /DNA_START=379 /DNA_END=798 /DNA_ORIENTATION=+